jgi:hypothetical protein
VGNEKQDQDALSMIRAIVQNGLIRPLDPLPVEWAEGRMVVIEDSDSGISDDLDEWYRELNRLGPAQYEPGEREQIRALLAEADVRAKELVRREMEAP